MKKRYYFDHNATTPVRPEVVDAMLPFLTEKYGNASSVHSFGRDARHAMEKSRETVANLINADPEEIYFTGCGTESDNIALTGTMISAQKSKKKLITSKVEHSAIMNTGAKLKRDGFIVTFLNVDEYCRTDLNQLQSVIDNETALVSIMHANNETGVLQDIEEAAGIAHSAGAVFHTDAVQSAGKIPIDVKKMGIDMLSMSGHKLECAERFGRPLYKKGIENHPADLWRQS